MEIHHKCRIAPPFPADYYSSGCKFKATVCFGDKYSFAPAHFIHCRMDFPSNSTKIRQVLSQSHSRARAEVTPVPQTQTGKADKKVANLFAGRKERVEFPKYDDECERLYPISEFLRQPAGFKSILNTKAVEDWQLLESNTYRCVLPKIKLLKFEVSPVLDLRVTPTSDDCTVEMLSCKFEGSEVVERQNDRFSASMRNHITWSTQGDRFLDADMKLNISLEVYTRPFTILPLSAIEKPGNLVMQSLVDRLVPLLLQNLIQDYENWVQEQYAAAAAVS